MMVVGQVRAAEDKDFDILRTYLTAETGWNLEYEKKGRISVWTKLKERCDEPNSFKMIRTKAELVDVTAETLYDVLHDPGYRSVWDKHVTDIKEIGHIDPNNSISYFTILCPSPMRNRDFVVQSSWRSPPPDSDQTNGDYMIINHSVFHRDCPPKKGHIRATSHLTGFLIRPTATGCELGYVTHSNPGGNIPAWLNDKLTTCFAPRYVKKIYKACLGYSEWKGKSGSPQLKPWLFPEQITSRRISIESDCFKPENSNGQMDASFEVEELVTEDILDKNTLFKDDSPDGISF